MSQMVPVSTVSTGRELLARYASTRRAFFPPVPPRRYKPPRPEPTIVYATPITIDRPISPRIVYDAPLIIHAPRDVDMALEEASIAKMLGKRIRVVEIIAAVSDHFGIRRSDLIGHRRARTVSRPRQVAMYLSKELTNRSLPEIGRLMGGKDHTTILHGYRQIWQLLDKGHAITSDVAIIRARLLA